MELPNRFGAPAEQIVYPGREHGFDFLNMDPMTADAIRRVVQFFHQRLLTDKLAG